MNIMNVVKINKYFALILVLWLLSLPVFAYEMDNCISCHGNNRNKDIPQISVPDYQSSIHGATITCLECHAYIQEGHEAGGVKEKVDCNMCHQQKNLHGASSAAQNKPKCYSCHTKHNILPSGMENSSVNRAHLKGTCSGCHETQYGKSGYLKGFTSIRIKSHKKENFGRDYDETNCTGCHQGMAIHGADEKVSDDDCAKCHMKDNKNAMMGRFHASNNSGLSIKGLSIITQILIFGVLILVIRFIVKAPWKQNRRGKS
jgi:hypothetical protein